jgi:ubiquinone/menaquinone biosynthesis C-methylase UbiE
MDEKTISAYNTLAREYDEKTTTFWDEFPKSVLDAFALRVGGKDVLNIGSGPGRDGLLLSSRGMKITCLDASEVMVAMCKERGLPAVHGDMLSLPFPDTAFCGVWAYTSLLHVTKQEMSLALSEVHRVLQPGGVFGLGMIEGEGECYRESSGVSMPRLFTYYTREELEQLLISHHFTIEYFEVFQPRNNRYLNYICTRTA